MREPLLTCQYEASGGTTAAARWGGGLLKAEEREQATLVFAYKGEAHRAHITEGENPRTPALE